MVDFLNNTVFTQYDIKIGIIGFIFGVSLFVIYLIASTRAAKRFDNWILKSISISFYKAFPVPTNPDPDPITGKQEYWRNNWLFQAFMYASAFCIVLLGQNVTSIISAVLFVLMSLNPSVLSGEKYMIPHMIGAIGGIVFANLSPVLFLSNYYILGFDILVVGVVSAIFWKKQHKLYAIECAAIGTMIFNYGVQIFMILTGYATI